MPIPDIYVAKAQQIGGVGQYNNLTTIKMELHTKQLILNLLFIKRRNLQYPMCLLTLQTISPWKPPATSKRSFTAIVLNCVLVKPSSKFPGFLYINKMEEVIIKLNLKKKKKVDSNMISMLRKHKISEYKEGMEIQLSLTRNNKS